MFDNYFKVDEAYPKGLSSYVAKLQENEHFDICIVNYVYLTKLFTKVKFPKTAVFQDSFPFVHPDCQNILI